MRPSRYFTQTTVVSVVLCCVAATSRAQQPRDARSRATGTSTITGVVMLDEERPAPIRRARVTLNSTELSIGRTVITDDEGTFSIDRLPAGRFMLAVVKDGYVPANYGARRPNRPGTPITLRDGEHRHVAVRMPRGSVITGTIVEADGRPVSGLIVHAIRFRFDPVAGERRLAAGGSSATDDRGMYRIFGLDAGDYFIVATAGGGPPRPGDLQVVSSEEVRRALAEVGGAGTRSARGAQTTDVAARPSVTERGRGVALAPVYYPGVADLSSATTITVGRAEERGAVDFAVQYVATASVSGTVGGGVAADRVSVALAPVADLGGPTMFRNTTVGPDGRFSISGIEPGTYTVLARQGTALWAKTDIVLSGEDVSVGLVLQPGLTIAGRIAFEGSKPPTTDFSKLRVPTPIVATGARMMPSPSVQMQADGRFALSGLAPGVYRFRQMVQGVRAPIGIWWLKSVTLGGRELLDAPFELQQSASDLVVTFSDRATELTGAVRDAAGNPVSDRFVVVFGADRGTWFPNSRRVAGEPLDAEGRYRIRNLPPGGYFMAVAEDLEPNEWFDPTVLEKLAASAIGITLTENQRKRQDWTVPAPSER